VGLTEDSVLPLEITRNRHPEHKRALYTSLGQRPTNRFRNTFAIGGRARGLVALGGVAKGVFAMGGVAIGICSFGGMAIGVVAFGGLGIGGLAFAGAAIGWQALGGGAIAWDVAAGGGAIAYHAAFGGGAIAHDIAMGGGAMALHANDAVAKAFFENHWMLQVLNWIKNHNSAFVISIIAMSLVISIVQWRLMYRRKPSVC